MRRVPGNQEIPVGIEGADVDAPFTHAVEDRASRDEVLHHLRVECGPPRRAIAEEVVPEGVESRLRVHHRPARTAAEGVLEGAIRRVLPHDEFRAIHGPMSRPVHVWNGRCDRSHRREPERDRVSAHEHRAEIAPGPELLERLRRRMRHVVERHAGVRGDVLEQAPPERLDLGGHRIHAGVRDPRPHAGEVPSSAPFLVAT